MFKVNNFKCGSTVFDIDFKDRVNLIVDNSGTGKTFMMELIWSYCLDNGISCTHVDYKHRDVPLSGEILLFDKADLYLTPEMFEKLKTLDAISIISIKDKLGLDYRDCGLYRLVTSYNSDGTIVKETKRYWVGVDYLCIV